MTEKNLISFLCTLSQSSSLTFVLFCFQVMVTATDLDDPQISKGVILTLLSAFSYASYLVLVKRKSDTEEKIDIPLFFGKWIKDQIFFQTRVILEL